MILKEKETGMVIEQVVIAPTNNSHARSVTHWQQVSGVVRDSGTSRVAVGKVIFWPYVLDDWEEVGE